MIGGIFVGGRGTRMGGVAKERLRARDTGEPLIVRAHGLLLSLGVTPVLVGNADAYADLLPELVRLADRPSGVGPLGGLSALLTAARGEHVIALACDMPFVSRALLAKLMAAPSQAEVVAAKGAGGFWEPLCARYRVESVRPRLDEALAAGERSFRALFARVAVAELVLEESERGELVDWDTEEDVGR